MVELKFKDIESLNAVTGALHKNRYKYSTFIVWKKDNGGIDYFTVKIEGVENGRIEIARVALRKNRHGRR